MSQVDSDRKFGRFWAIPGSPNELWGTYVDGGDELTLEVTGFDIDPAAGNTSMVGPDGSQCIIVQGFASTPVCFPTPQTGPFTMANDRMTVVIDNSIAGAPVAPTTFTLTRSLGE